MCAGRTAPAGSHAMWDAILIAVVVLFFGASLALVAWFETLR